MSRSTRGFGTRRAGRVVHYGEKAALPLAAVGFLAPHGTDLKSPSTSPVYSLIKQGDVDTTIYRLKQSIPFIGNDPNRKLNRRAVGLALVLQFGRSVPVVRGLLRRVKWKSGRRTYTLG
jgi:hypothetical protein